MIGPGLWQEVWTEYEDMAKARQPSFDPADYYTSGRVSKQFPNKEDPHWWSLNGPRFVESWVSWRALSGLNFAEFPDLGTGEAVPAIEVEVIAQLDEWMVKSVIDRVMVDANGDLYIIDLKTGSMTPPWPLQLALNNLCLRHTYGESAKWGGYWSARKGGVEQWHDLDRFTDELLWDWVMKAYAIRDQQLFIPNANNLCKSACGVAQHCVAMGGTPFFPAHATTTRNEE